MDSLKSPYSLCIADLHKSELLFKENDRQNAINLVYKVYNVSLKYLIIISEIKNLIFEILIRHNEESNLIHLLDSHYLNLLNKIALM